MRAGLLLVLGALVMSAASTAHASDEPPHIIEREIGDIQIRLYEPMIQAEVTARGDLRRAGNAGFRPLADYIFGNNQSRSDKGSADIAMTTPVTQTRASRIAMTTPVTQTQAEADSWRVAFIMPPEWSMDTLPTPNNSEVALRELPARRIAAIRFSGGPDEARFARHAQRLLSVLEEEGYRATGDPIYARYDPPWVPTPFRRNEVMIEIE